MPEAKGKDEAAVCSPRRVLLEIRRELLGGVYPSRRPHFGKRLRDCHRERRDRKTAKEKRVWPRRKEHKPPGPPQVLTLTNAQKRLLSRCQTAA